MQEQQISPLIEELKELLGKYGIKPQPEIKDYSDEFFGKVLFHAILDGNIELVVLDDSIRHFEL